MTTRQADGVERCPTSVVGVAVLPPGGFTVGLVRDDKAVCEADLGGGGPAQPQSTTLGEAGM